MKPKHCSTQNMQYENDSKINFNYPLMYHYIIFEIMVFGKIKDIIKKRQEENEQRQAGWLEN